MRWGGPGNVEIYGRWALETFKYEVGGPWTYLNIR